MYLISEIFFTALEGLILILAFSILSFRKDFIFKNSMKVLIFVFVYTIYTYWLTLFLPKGIHTILLSILIVITLNFIFNENIIKSILKFSIIFLGMTIIESILAMLMMFILNIPLNSLLNNDFYVFLCSIIAKIFEIIIILILYKSNLTVSWLKDDNHNQSSYKKLLIIIATFLFFMIFTNIFISDNTHNLVIYNIFSFAIYIVLILAILLAFREGSKMEIIQLASDLKKEQIQQLIEFNEMVAKERHEYKNHLNTIYGLCTLNKPDMNDKIKQYINNFANNSETKNINIDSGNDFVDAIINVKYNNALKKGIEVLPDFEEPLSVARVDEDSAVTIISNIIENAFESMNSYEKDNKFVRIETYIEDGSYYISISNDGPMIPEADKKKIFNAGFSTKDNSTKKRGFGLSIVQAEIEQCGGSISLNSSEEITEFLITLKINDEQAVV